MRRKQKKSKGMRGNKTHGWGSRKKHRGSGNRGGFGLAGTGKKADQRKSWVYKVYGRAYFGKHGFVRHTGRKIVEDIRTINVGDLGRFEGSEVDLEKNGYNKLLGNGTINKKLRVIVRSASSTAVEKIKNAGGEVIVKE